ncbi:hypothetical protein [Poriferisphaera corsica]|uniref:hypothetical protein n=1 Tax=Poriferisphaera corsica TaxID=2528020 RepID=UPI00119EA4F6|nr:hypothetical protein [Poriferisphaera corsica]
MIIKRYQTKLQSTNLGNSDRFIVPVFKLALEKGTLNTQSIVHIAKMRYRPIAIESITYRFYDDSPAYTYALRFSGQTRTSRTSQDTPWDDVFQIKAYVDKVAYDGLPMNLINGYPYGLADTASLFHCKNRIMNGICNIDIEMSFYVIPTAYSHGLDDIYQSEDLVGMYGIWKQTLHSEWEVTQNGKNFRLIRSSNIPTLPPQQAAPIPTNSIETISP